MKAIKDFLFVWCDLFLVETKIAAIPLSYYELEVLRRLSFMENTKENFSKVVKTDIENDFICKIIKTRSEFIGLDLSIYAIPFLRCFVNNPAEAVMFVYVIKYYMHKNSLHGNADIKLLCEIFTEGFRCTNMQELWNKQKADEHNVLDLCNKETFENLH